MLVIEVDARLKWCPFARVARRESTDPREPPLAGVTQIVGGTNRDGFSGVRNPVSCRCLASDCMAWRWEHESSPRGFCGLAGSPPLPSSDFA